MRDKEKQKIYDQEKWKKLKDDPVFMAKRKEYLRQYNKINRDKHRLRDRARWESEKNNPERKERRCMWENKNKEELAAYQKEYRAKNKIRLQKQKLARLYEIKKIVLKEFGSKCACCGESEVKFLTMDHINGRKDETKARTTGHKLWARVYHEGCPKEKYQILCFNCNCAKGIYGSCPHNHQLLKKEK
jgi:hypothetical protein